MNGKNKFSRFTVLILLYFMRSSLVQAQLQEISPNDKVFIPDANGWLIMEAENSKVPAGWKLETSFSGYNGSGYLVWADKNSIPTGKDEQALYYRIYIPEGGEYHFRMRSYITSENNDIWIAIDDVLVKEYLKPVEDDSYNYKPVEFDTLGFKPWPQIAETPWIKLFSDKSPECWNMWSWASRFFPVKGLRDNTPSWVLTEGLHTIRVAPRVKDFCIDRIALIPRIKVGRSSAYAVKQPEAWATAPESKQKLVNQIVTDGP
jgi:hypothetical protein